MTSRQHPHLDRLIARARKSPPVATAVVYPCEATALNSALKARDLGLITPLFVGPAAKINAVAKQAGHKLAKAQVIDTGDDPREATHEAARCFCDGQIAVIAKGSLHTDELLSVLISRDAGLRTKQRVTHAFVMDVPEQPRPLMLADCVVNITPSIVTKKHVVQNAVHLAHALGIAKPKVAVLSAVESVNPSIQSTLDAVELKRLAREGDITGCVIDGPFAMDNALSADAARIKGIQSSVPGHADILIVPTLDAGNILYKALIYLAGAECAGLVLGLRAPVVLTSRADSETTRVASYALASIAATAASVAARAA